MDKVYAVFKEENYEPDYLMSLHKTKEGAEEAIKVLEKKEIEKQMRIHGNLRWKDSFYIEEIEVK